MDSCYISIMTFTAILEIDGENKEVEVTYHAEGEMAVEIDSVSLSLDGLEITVSDEQLEELQDLADKDLIQFIANDFEVPYEN